MANWGSHTDEIENSDEQWKIKIRSIESTLRNIKNESDNLNQKFKWLKQNNGNMEGFQKWIEKLNISCQTITQELLALTKLAPQSHDVEYVSKSNQLKQLKRRVDHQVNYVQNLTQEIRREMERRFMEKKQMLGDSMGDTVINGRQSADSANLQMTQLENDKQSQELAQAEIELQHMAHLSDQTYQLRQMFQQMAEIIHDDGEMVDKIVVNVDVAAEKVDAGTAELDKAVTYKKSAYRKKIIIGAIVLLVVVVIIIVVVLSIKLEK